MSDDQGGYENDLREAENAMAAAGHPDIALGMRRHSEAQRNMMQGVLVPMFVAMVERVLDTKLAPVSNQIGGLRGDTAALQSEFRTGLAGIQDTVSALAETVDGLQSALDDIQAWRTGADERMAKIEQDDRNDIRTEIKNTNLEIVSMKAILKQYDGQLRELVERLAERGGGEEASSDNGG